MTIRIKNNPEYEVKGIINGRKWKGGLNEREIERC